ncbi:MAG: hypothetical protein EB127_29745, partial [Alphaproteobacteria bacterium]|nr:hypothetical protein [Alphaproteobacteria bacterium]
PKTPRIIIPTSDYSYATRDIRDKLTDKQKKYSKTKEGSVNIFNVEVLKQELPCFVTEGEFDALSFLELGYSAVSLGSASNTRSFLKKIKELSNNRSLIIVLDADKSGKKASEQLVAGLQELNISFIAPEIKGSEVEDVYRSEFYGNYKDANDFLVKDKIGFENKIKKALSDLEDWISTEIQAKLEETEIEKAEYIETNISSHITLFKEWVSSGKDKKVISTGFINLDEYLDGGLYDGLYILGAISSLGKTTFAIQIADYLSSQGHDVLYISLEMSEDKIAQRFDSILTLVPNHRLKEQGTYPIVKERLSLVQNKFDGAKLIIKEFPVGQLNVNQIRSLLVQLRLHHEFVPDIIIVDYLELLRPNRQIDTEYQAQERIAQELRGLAMENN